MNRGQSSPGARYRLSRWQRCMAWKWVLRTEEGFKTAQQILAVYPHLLQPALLLQSCWESLRQHWQVSNRPPSEAEMVSYLERSRSSWLISSQDAQEADALLDFIYADDTSNQLQQDHKLYAHWLSLWFEELITDSVGQQLSIGSELIPSDLPEFLRKAALHIELAKSSGNDKLTVPFPDEDDLLEKPVTRYPTGIPTLDSYMNGGQIPTEVYGFCGPPGSCKTMVGIQLAVEAAKFWQTQVDDPERCPRVYLVLWEGPLDYIKRRILSYAAEVAIDSLEQGKDALSTHPGNLKPYELEMYRDQAFSGQKRLSEKERLEIARKRLNRNFRILDFTGGGAYQAASCQMCQGVKMVIDQDQQSNGNPGVGMIVLDYAGLAVRKYLNAHGRRADELRHHLVAWGGLAKALLAETYRCPVWCLHQLGTEAAARSPGAIPKMTDSAEAKNFLENMDFGFYVGVPTRENLCVLSMVKQRRAGRMPERIWLIDGRLNRIMDVSHMYKRTPVNTIVPMHDYSVSAVESDQNGVQAEDLARQSAIALFSKRCPHA